MKTEGAGACHIQSNHWGESDLTASKFRGESDLSLEQKKKVLRRGKGVRAAKKKKKKNKAGCATNWRDRFKSGIRETFQKEGEGGKAMKIRKERKEKELLVGVSVSMGVNPKKKTLCLRKLE